MVVARGLGVGQDHPAGYAYCLGCLQGTKMKTRPHTKKVFLPFKMSQIVQGQNEVIIPKRVKTPSEYLGGCQPGDKNPWPEFHFGTLKRLLEKNGHLRHLEM